MAASVTTNEIATALLRKIDQQSRHPLDAGLGDPSALTQFVVHDSNKRPRVASTGELETHYTKNTTPFPPGPCSSVAYGT